MEIQSGNGAAVASGAAVTSSSPPRGPRAEPHREDPPAAKKIERFHVPLDSLKMMFENPVMHKTEVARERGALSPKHPRAQGGQHNGVSMDLEEQQTPGKNMSSKQDQTAGGAGGARTGLPEEAERQWSRAPAEGTEPEPIPLKERLAMYQAAVSKKEAGSSSGMVVEEAEVCSLPGGLAGVKKQFESQEIASSHSTVTQVHIQHRSVQEVSSSSEVTVRSKIREVVPSTHQAAFIQEEKVSHDQSVHKSSVASDYANHYEETVKVIGGEDLPKISTQALKQQFERAIEDATPSKQIKIDVDYNQFQWAPVVNVSSKASTGKTTTVSSVTSKVEEAASSSASASAAIYESMESLPPPPPELLQPPSEHSEGYSPEPPEPAPPSKQSVNKQYTKQRNLYELKRLYKHIHPEVRKNLERDFFSDVTEIERTQLESQEEVTGDVQQARSVFENTGSSPSKCMSPEREYLEWDEILKGEVQSMRWMFENKPLDTIKDESADEDEVRNIAQQEIIAGNDVKYTAWMFETQPMDSLGTENPDSEQKGKCPELARGDVRTATWLFETQPLDTLNKVYNEEGQTTEVILTNDVTRGDVKTARYLFETQHLDSLGHTEATDETHFLQLKSELEEIKGEVKTTTQMFETQPMCVIRGDSGQMLEITTVRREETEKGDVKTSRWLFETQPLDMINRDPTQVKVVCGVSMEGTYQDNVKKGRWLFETKTLDSIRDEEWEGSTLQKEEIIGADVRKQCWVFETQPMDTLKDDSNARPMSAEEIVGGDVRAARHLFETVPMEDLKENREVGKLQKLVASEEEKGDVRHQKWVFESQPLENIREEKKEFIRTVNLEELDKGDVSNYKEIFETMDLSRCDESQKIQVEGVTSGSVRSNKVLFESTPLYAMQDSSGHYHEVKTVRREEIVKGDVRSCKWMFETRPIDQFDESITKFQIIKGISKQEVEAGDVKTAKWLFETQPLDSIKYFSNVEDEESEVKAEVEIVKGDVKTCQWLFETQQMDTLYEKEKNESETEEIHKGDVKTCTWMFETQNLDTIRDESETVIKTRTVQQEDVQSKDVRMVRFLFETENLENITGEEDTSFKKVTNIDIQSGDVSRMKYIFENQSSDIMTSTSEETMHKLKTIQAEDIQRGNVVNCKWMFENQPMDAICEDSEEHKTIRTVVDVQGGNVEKERFIFETTSLDNFQKESSDTEVSQLQRIMCQQEEKGDVKNYTMMFETQPLYAIQDKEGHYHEVTTVTKEEIMRGDVVGARWLFETKPLDSIKDTDEVYIIKSVTEEDINKGDVSSARWRFETQPLDEIAEDIKVSVKTVSDVQGGDVKTNKQRFECNGMSQQLVRTVSVSEIHKGDVKTATWMFETHTLDKIRSEDSEYNEMETVRKEEVLRGDVKQSVWLFEKQPLDSINTTEETDVVVTREEIPNADVKTTKWLFETTPVHEFNEKSIEKVEIIGKSIKETLDELYSQKMVASKGVLIEADEIGDVRMAKFKLMNQDEPQIQREEVLKGDIKNIMMNLLNKGDSIEKGIIINEEERGNINTTVKQLYTQEVGSIEKEEIIRGDIQEAINNLFKGEGSAKHGILIQEDEKGDVRMTIYSLLNRRDETVLEKEDIVKGNVRSTLHTLLTGPDAGQMMKITVSDTEKGNVNFYSTCIESGALEYLKNLQVEPEDILPEKEEKEKIVGGDIKATKLILKNNQLQIERTVTEDDIVPGDVHNTVKVFMTEPVVSLNNIEKEDIVRGDLRATLDSLSQAINQTVMVEKEEVIKGDISTTLRSLEEAKNLSKEIEKPEIVPGDIKGALESLGKSATTKVEIVIEDLVPGDIKGTLKSLEEAKQLSREIEKEEIVKGDIQTAMQSLREASNEKKVYQQQVSVQGDVRGTIQLLLEPPPPSTQRRPSTEGDVKMSIKSLYNGQDQTQIEKEEVIKGDVQGTIKCLLQGKEHTSAKTTVNDFRKAKATVKAPLLSQQEIHECSVETKTENEAVKPAPAVKNLSQCTESQNTLQKHTATKSVKSKSLAQEEHSLTTQTAAINMARSPVQINVKERPPKQKVASPAPVVVNKKNVSNLVTENTATSAEISNQSQSSVNTEHTQETKTVSQVQTTVIEQKTITKKHDVKTLKTEFRNLDVSRQGHIKTGKKKMKPEIHFPPPPTSPPPPSESEFPLPPPPPPVEPDRQTFPTPPPPDMRQDSDLPPPPPPPVESLSPEPDHFPPPPPPPPPSMAGQDVLPPPPSQQELESMPSHTPHQLPAEAKKMTVKPVKAPALYKVPKLETSRQFKQEKTMAQKKKMPPPPPPQPSVMTSQTQIQQVMTATEVFTASNTVTEISKPEETMKTEIQAELNPLPLTEATSGTPLTKPAHLESPRPPRKVFSPPKKLPLPTVQSPPAKPKTYARKFKTPLMMAEEKYRKQREDEIAAEDMTPTSPPGNADLQVTDNAVIKEDVKEDTIEEKSEKNIASNVIHAEMALTEAKLDAESLHPAVSTGLTVSQKSVSQSSGISSAKQHITFNQTVVSRHQSSSVSSTKHQTVSAKTEEVISAQSDSSSNIKDHPSGSTTPEQLEGSSKTGPKSLISKQDIMQDITNLQSQTSASIKTEGVKKAESSAVQGPGKVPPQPTKMSKVTPKFRVKTVKVPKLEKIENQEQNKDTKLEDQVVVTDTSVLMNVVQESTEVSGAIEKHIETEVKVTENKLSEKAAPTKEKKPEKVIPKFKVKTVKLPKAEKIEKQEKKIDVTVSETCDVKVVQENIHKVAGGAQSHTEIESKVEKVEEQQQDSNLEVQMKKPKQKLKKEKERLPSPIKVATAHKDTKSLSTLKTTQEQEELRVLPMQKAHHEEHTQVHEEVIITESKVRQSFQQQGSIQVQMQVKSSQKQKEESSKKQIQEKPKGEYKQVSVKLIGKPDQKGAVQVVAEDTQNSEVLQRLLSHIEELQGTAGKMDSKKVKTMLSEIPEWLISPEEKNDFDRAVFERNVQKLTEITEYVKNLVQSRLLILNGNSTTVEKHVSERTDAAGAIPKTCKVSIGSVKVGTQKKVLTEKKSSHDSRKQELVEGRAVGPRTPSPMIRMRSPSPSYITIESIRKTDSPQRVAPSPPPMPPTPPPRRSETPSSQISRATPSPTFSRADKLAKLKDTTAMLSQRASPPPPQQSAQFVEKKAEIVESPTSFHRQIKIETSVMETSETSDPSASASVKDKKDFFEEAQKAEVNKTYMRKEPINIPERLGLDVEEMEKEEKEKEELPRVDLSQLVNKFESPEQKVYVRKEPILIAERLGTDLEETDTQEDKKVTLMEEIPTFSIKAIRTVFETTKKSSQAKEQDDKQEAVEPDIMTDGSKQADSSGPEKGSRLSSPLPVHHEEKKEESIEPTGLSETKSVSEQFSSADKFGNKLSGSRSSTTVSKHAESVVTRRAPPTYADVVKGKVPVLDVPAEDSPEELLKNFHKTWTDSQNVFKSLGYTISEERTSRVVSHQEQTVITENSSSRVGPVPGVSKEGVSDGIPDSRQTKLP
ncbi:xin actin-binding repeat-containing protein 2 isoform X2 [Anguilla rostrata]|uniref:xin actin-binding repeat-containing protein 2 isoform X2 n=1 Tax=Anguilla rostrata TaxID=7938 RepID=UPI0030CFD551